jgi:superfamily II DNA or RNA helicase
VLNIWGQAPYFLGVSATPDRNDKREKIYFSYFDELMEVKIEDNYEIEFHFVGVKSRTNKIFINQTKTKREKFKAIQQNLQNLIDDEQRNQIILEKVLGLLQDGNVNCILISQRISQL